MRARRRSRICSLFAFSRSPKAVLIFSGFLSVIIFSTGAAELPKALLTGDSTTGPNQGYSGFTTHLLSAVADATYSYVGVAEEPCPGECWDTMGSLLEESVLSKTIDQAWDVIHFSQGLHTLSWIDSLSTQEKTQRITLYEQNLTEFLTRLKTGLPECKIIFATLLPTDSCAAPTLMPELGCRRTNENVIAYNEAALRVCSNLAIPVNDLYTFAVENNLRRVADGTHYELDAREKIGKQVAEYISEALSGNPVRHFAANSAARSGEGVQVKFAADSRACTIQLQDGAHFIRSVQIYDLQGRMFLHDIFIDKHTAKIRIDDQFPLYSLIRLITENQSEHCFPLCIPRH